MALAQYPANLSRFKPSTYSCVRPEQPGSASRRYDTHSAATSKQPQQLTWSLIPVLILKFLLASRALLLLLWFHQVHKCYLIYNHAHVLRVRN